MVRRPFWKSDGQAPARVPAHARRACETQEQTRLPSRGALFRAELVYLLAEFPSLSETFILREMSDLVARGVPLCIYAFRKPRTGAVHAEAEALMKRVHYRPALGTWRWLRAHWRTLLGQPKSYLSLLAQVIQESGKEKERWRHRLVAFDAAVGAVDLARVCGARHLHAHFASVPATTARYAAALLGIPFSVSAHARDIFVDGRQDRAALEANLRAAAFVVTCTDYARHYLLAQFPDLPSEKLHRVYHGFYPERFTSGDRSQTGPARILTVGRLVPKKGLHILLEACGRLKQRGHHFLLVIAGDGPERGRLTNLAERLGLSHQVLFLGQVTQEDLIPVYGEAHLFALPCVVDQNGDRDGLPNVILEAMAAGLPVVSTPISGIPEAIADGETGILVPPGDSEALAEALERLLEDPALRCRLGRAGQERVRHDFDIRSSPLAKLFQKEAGITASRRNSHETEGLR